MRIKTLGVCFGHQCFAHAFGASCNEGEGSSGRAIKCPTGSKAGRVSSQLTHEGRQLLLRDDSNSNNDSNDKKCSMELLYTHGDMVHSLPDFAVSLGGNTNVPIEAYYSFATAQHIRVNFNWKRSEGEGGGRLGMIYAKLIIVEDATTFVKTWAIIVPACLLDYCSKHLSRTVQCCKRWLLLLITMIIASSFLKRYSFQTAAYHVLRRPTESMAVQPFAIPSTTILAKATAQH